MLKEAQKAGATEFDEEKRAEIYRRAIDQVNRMNYILPLADLPIVFVHTKDVRIGEDPLSPLNNHIRDYYWNN